MVGQYQEPDGTAAPAAGAPVWNIIYSLSLLMDTGGSRRKAAARKTGISQQRSPAAAPPPCRSAAKAERKYPPAKPNTVKIRKTDSKKAPPSISEEVDGGLYFFLLFPVATARHTVDVPL